VKSTNYEALYYAMFSRPSVISSVLGPNTLFSILFSDTLKLYSLFSGTDNISRRIFTIMLIDTGYTLNTYTRCKNIFNII